MPVKYGSDSSKTGGGKREGQPTPKGSNPSSGQKLGSYGSKKGGGAWTSPK